LKYVLKPSSLFSRSAVVQNNVRSKYYRVCRMNETPERVNIHIVESDAPPAGVGEHGLPPFAPALCNAIFAATGNRVRELPLSKGKLTSL